jgi:3D-(3,5/4)-trihydroxycyclohexane-1,2-dione acylhydrolase (decyclizing)
LLPQVPNIDFAAHARALGAISENAGNIGELEAALGRALAAERTSVIVIETDPERSTDAGGAWWDVPVSEVSDRPAVRDARRAYDERVGKVRP